MADTARVALIKGDDRYGNVARALALIADQVDLRGKQRILIKPNFVKLDNQLAATHVDAVRAVLDFLRPRTSARITIGEGTAVGDTLDGYRNYGYTALAETYNVEMIDLNRGEWVEAPVYTSGLKDMRLRLSRTVVESDFRISVGPPKTHDTVIVTLSLKNMIMGSLIRDQRDGGAARPVMRRLHGLVDAVPAPIMDSPFMETMKSQVARRIIHSDKAAMHMGYPLMNLNLARLAPLVYPHLAVIDGFVGMEGDGPTRGDPVDLRCAVAGRDFLAVDVVAAALMGVDADKVGYLHYCTLKGLGVGDLAHITVLGNTVAECRRAFRPHASWRAQGEWRMANVERLL